jgi:hypothetical protein
MNLTEALQQELPECDVNQGFVDNQAIVKFPKEGDCPQKEFMVDDLGGTADFRFQIAQVNNGSPEPIARSKGITGIVSVIYTRIH